jgi:hypothetical protein
MTTVHQYDSVARSLDRALTQIAHAISAIPGNKIGELPVRTAVGDAYDAVKSALGVVQQATNDVFASES